MTQDQFNKDISILENAILAADSAQRSIALKAFKDIINDLKRYAELALKLLNVLAKYFFVGGKLSAPAPWKIWIYFRLVRELYDIFSSYRQA